MRVLISYPDDLVPSRDTALTDTLDLLLISQGAVDPLPSEDRVRWAEAQLRRLVRSRLYYRESVVALAAGSHRVPMSPETKLKAAASAIIWITESLGDLELSKEALVEAASANFSTRM